MQVRAIVAGDLCLYDLPLKSYERIIQTFTLSNPKYGMAIAMKRDVSGIPEFIQVAEEHPDGSIRIPRGAVEEAKKALRKDQVTLAFEDCRSRGFGFEVKKNPELRPYQEDGVSQILSHTQGSIVIGCGGGKTRLGIATIGRLARSTLVLVHTVDLLDQWVAGLQELLGLDSVGTVKEGVEQYRATTVALIQTLIDRIGHPVSQENWNGFGFCIVDECHHSPATTYQKLLQHIPAKYRLGLTATPEREDRMTKLMDWSFGSRLLEMSANELVNQGYLMRPDLEVVNTDFEFNYDGPDKKKTAALARSIVEDDERNQLIADIATRDAKAGETVVILSNHRAHCRALGRLCWERGVETAVLISGASKKAKAARQQAIEALRTGELKLAVATSLFDEGVDVERLSRIVLALPQKAKGGTEQRTGRLMRLFKGKNPKLYDIVDPNVEMLERRWRQRKSVYRKLGLVR